MEADLYMPVRMDGLPKGMILVATSAKGIEVRIRGPESRVSAIKKAPPRYAVDMTDARIGMQSIPVDPARMPFSGGVSVVAFSPETLDVEVARELRKAFPVTVTHAGTPAPGRRVKDSRAKPFAVIVRGPERLIEQIESIATKPIDITGVAETFKKEVALEIPEGLLLDGPAQVVTVEVEINEEIVIRQLKGLAITGKGSRYRYRIMPPAIDIEVKGPVRVLDTLVKDKGIKVYMDLKDLAPGVYPRRAVLKFPPEVTLVSTNPEIFTVTIFKGGER